GEFLRRQREQNQRRDAAAQQRFVEKDVAARRGAGDAEEVAASLGDDRVDHLFELVADRADLRRREAREPSSGRIDAMAGKDEGMSVRIRVHEESSGNVRAEQPMLRLRTGK